MSAIATPTAPAGTTTPPPASAGPKPWKWTREQYRKLSELGFFGDHRVQLIFGEIVEMGRQNWPHAAALALLVQVLQRAFTPGYWIHEQKPFPVAGSEPEPDAAVIPGSPRDYTDHPTSAALIVEVSDTTLAYDTTTKAELYATANVEEYWVLEWPAGNSSFSAIRNRSLPRSARSPTGRD